MIEDGAYYCDRCREGITMGEWRFTRSTSEGQEDVCARCQMKRTETPCKLCGLPHFHDGPYCSACASGFSSMGLGTRNVVETLIITTREFSGRPSPVDDVTAVVVKAI